jgi:putative endonuclease
MPSLKTSNRSPESKRKRRVAYYVYIILCEGNTLYTGYTKNVDSRLKLHQKGKGARYTKMHRPKKLLHVEEFGSRAEAMKREKRIKKLTHTQKLKLTHTNTNRRKVKRAQSVSKRRGDYSKTSDS